MGKKILNITLFLLVGLLWVFIWTEFNSADKNVANNQIATKSISPSKKINIDSLLTVNPFEVPHARNEIKTQTVKRTKEPVSVQQISKPNYYLLGITGETKKLYFIIGNPNGNVEHLQLKDTLSSQWILNSYKNDTLWVYFKQDKKKFQYPIMIPQQ